MIMQGLQPFCRLLASRGARSVHFHIRSDEWSDQPRPHRSLVICAIAFNRASLVASAILRIAGRESTQTVRREQMFANFLDYASRAVWRQHGEGQTDSKNLIGADGGVREVAVNHVIKTALFLVPEQAVEGPVRHGRHVAVAFLGSIVSKSEGEYFHDAERVVPKRLDLYWLAPTRSHNPVAHFGVHPGELNAGFAGGQQAAGIDFDSVTGAAGVPGNNVGEHGIEFSADELFVSGIGTVGAGSLEEP